MGMVEGVCKVGSSIIYFCSFISKNNNNNNVVSHIVERVKIVGSKNLNPKVF